MFKHVVKKIIILLCIILINSSFVLAQNINDGLRVAIPGLGSNARALGMGNSYIGLSDDGSAAFFNPAGFGLLKRLEFAGGLSYLSYNNDADFFNDNTSYSNSNTELNRLSFAFPFPTLRGSLVFGLSYHTTKDLTSSLKFDGFNNGNTSMIQDLNRSVYFDDNDNPYNIPRDLLLTSDSLISRDLGFFTPISGRLNQSGNIIADGSIHNWTFSGAIEIYKNLFAGLNLNIITGNFKSDNEYYEDDYQDNYSNIETDPGNQDTRGFQTFYLNRILDWDISGWDAKFGILYQLNDNARFGLTIQFPKTYNIKEDFTVEGYSKFNTNRFDLYTDDYSDAVEYDISTPFELGAGFSYNLKGLILSAQGTIIDYSQMKFEDVSGLGTIAEDINRDIRDQLKSVVNYNVGIEYTIPNSGIRVRGGFFVQPSPYQDDPTEFDRKYATAGIGFLTDETVGIDIAYAYGWWKDVGDNYGSDVSRTFQDVTTNQFIITGTYRF